MNAEITPERRKLRRENAMRSQWRVLQDMRENAPDLWRQSKCIGGWIWLDFDAPPPKEVRDWLLDAGFHWNAKRRCWQHACGAFCHHSTGDPTWKYGVVPATEVTELQATA